MVCHAKDLINTIFNDFSWYSAYVSSVALKGPILTTVGVIIGAFIAALISGEFRFRFVEPKIKAFICGFMVMCSGLIIAGCPMRLLLRTAYGDFSAILTIACIILGIFLATRFMLRKKKA